MTITTEHPKNTRVVMCRGQWGEENYQDFLMFALRDGETDDEGIARAHVSSGDPRDDFYVTKSESQTQTFRQKKMAP